MRLYNHTMKTMVSLLSQTSGAGGNRSGGTAQAFDAFRHIGNTLHCASVFSLDEVPHRFLRKHPAFAGNEALLGADFTLPDAFTYIEDPISGVALVDVKPGQKGLAAPRAFVLIEENSAANIVSAVNFESAFQVLVETPDAFDDSIVIHTGFVSGMDTMGVDDPVDARFRVDLDVRDAVILGADGSVRVFSDPFSPVMAGSDSVKLGVSVDKAQHMLSLLAGNLRCGMRELAYYQASKNAPDCRVKLERQGR